MVTDQESDVYRGDLDYEARIQHVRYTLADICLKRYTDRFSFLRLLNRVLILFQEPICFAVCRPANPSGKAYQVDQNTIRDPLFEEQFKTALVEELGYSEKSKHIPKTKAQEFAIRLFSTNYHIICFSVKRNSRADFKKQNVSYKPIRVDSGIGLVLRDVFAPFGKALRLMDIDKSLDENFDRLFDKSNFITATQDNSEKYPATDLARDITAIYARKPPSEKVISDGRVDYKSIEEVLEAELGDIIESSILRGNGDRIANALLSRKCFDRHDVRFDRYFYDIKLFISDKQRTQFAQVVGRCNRDRLMQFQEPKAEKWFWAAVKRGRIEELLGVLDTPLSRGVRLFPEYALMSGAAIINVNPFARSDVGWIKGALDPDEREHEFRRLAVLHYLLQLMAPGVPQPSLLTLPLRVSGATWMSATFVVSGVPDAGGVGVDSLEAPIVDSDEFQKRFLIYHSLTREFESRLRRKSKEAYIQAVYDIFIKYVDERRRAAGRAKAEQGIDLHPDDFKALNDRMTALSRLYPFDTIHFGAEGSLSNIEQYRAGGLGEACNCEFGILDRNPFFDRLRLRSFLDRDEVLRRLRDLINAEIGLKAHTRRGIGLVHVKAE